MSREISLAEVALHNTEKDCWIIVHGKVYEVSKYLNDHPGGVDIVAELAGKDATEDYDDVGHTSDANEILEKFLIGKVSKNAPAPAAAAAASKPAAAPSSSAPAPIAKPVAAAAPSKSSASKPKVPEPESDSSMVMVGGLVAAVAVAFFLFKRSQAA